MESSKVTVDGWIYLEMIVQDMSSHKSTHCDSIVWVVVNNQPQVAVTLHKLGVMTGGEQGIDLLKRSLQLKRNIFGEDHRKIAKTLFRLSCLHLDLGQLKTADEMAQDALRMLKTHDVPCKWNTIIWACQKPKQGKVISNHIRSILLCVYIICTQLYDSDCLKMHDNT